MVIPCYFYKRYLNVGLFTYSELIEIYEISPYHLSQIKRGNYPTKLKEKGINIERV